MLKPNESMGIIFETYMIFLLFKNIQKTPIAIVAIIILKIYIICLVEAEFFSNLKANLKKRKIKQIDNSSPNINNNPFKTYNVVK